MIIAPSEGSLTTVSDISFDRNYFQYRVGIPELKEIKLANYLPPTVGVQFSEGYEIISPAILLLS